MRRPTSAAAHVLRFAAAALLLGCEAPTSTAPAEADRPEEVPRLGATIHLEGEDARRAYVRLLQDELSGPASGARPAMPGRPDALQRELVRARRTVVAEDPVSPDEAPRFTTATTDVSVNDVGRGSTGQVRTFSIVDQFTNISHHIDIRLTTPSGTMALPPVDDATGYLATSILGTVVPISGINCTVPTTLGATAKHSAWLWWRGTTTAISVGSAACGPTKTACAPGTSFTNVSYDPYASPESGCEDGGSDGTAAGCHEEYVYVDMSYDDGATWTTVWEGYATVCG